MQCIWIKKNMFIILGTNILYWFIVNDLSINLHFPGQQLSIYQIQNSCHGNKVCHMSWIQTKLIYF